MVLPAGDEGVGQGDATGGEDAFFVLRVAVLAVNCARGKVVDFADEGGTVTLEVVRDHGGDLSNEYVDRERLTVVEAKPED